MTDHQDECSCGEQHRHNTQPNPFTDPIREAAYREFVLQLFRMGCVTVPHSIETTVNFVGVACLGMCPPGPADRMVTLRALMFELARLASDISGGREPQFRVAIRCEDPDHDHPPMRELDDGHGGTPEQEFGTDLMKAFFTAVSEGDLASAVRVGDAISHEADGTDRHPEGYFVALLGNCLASLAYTTVQGSPMHPRALFED